MLNAQSPCSNAQGGVRGRKVSVLNSHWPRLHAQSPLAGIRGLKYSVLKALRPLTFPWGIELGVWALSTDSWRLLTPPWEEAWQHGRERQDSVLNVHDYMNIRL